MAFTNLERRFAVPDCASVVHDCSIFFVLDHESKSERKCLGFCVFFFCRNCGLLLWLVRAQHDHYKSKSEIKSETLVAFPLQQGKRCDMSRLSFVIVFLCESLSLNAMP